MFFRYLVMQPKGRTWQTFINNKATVLSENNATDLRHDSICLIFDETAGQFDALCAELGLICKQRFITEPEGGRSRLQ
jgi:hypothetical protein